VQIALALVWRVPHALELGQSVAIPLVVTLVYAFVSADSAEAPVPESLVWERFLERAWAVIVIDFFVSWLWTTALLDTASSQPIELIGGIFALILVVLTTFVDASATLDDDVTVWTVIPQALLRGIAVMWNRTTFVRGVAIFSMQLLVFVFQLELYYALAALHAPQALFWSQISLSTIVAPPIAAITAIVYRDATAVLR
jgi:hypothetical protein